MKQIVKKITEQTDLSEIQAWWLVEFATKQSRACLQLRQAQLDQQEQALLDQAVDQINNQAKPLSYIIGSTEFLNLKLWLQAPTLIPRPETEYWVDQVITMITSSTANKNLTILDIGTGSGCIALALAQAFPLSQVYAVDIADAALQLAQKNAAYNGIDNVTFLHSNLFASIPESLQFDLILSNPPYIDPTAHLEKSVLDWEDHGALFASNKGAAIIQTILEQAKIKLKKNIELPYQIIIEIDASQQEQLLALGKHYHYERCKVEKDQFGRDRTFWAQ